MDSISPYPYFIEQSPEAGVVSVQGELGLQGDYWNVSATEEPMTTDHCQTWGTVAQDAAFMVCIKASSLNQTYLFASIPPDNYLIPSYGSLPQYERTMFERYHLATINSDCYNNGLLQANCQYILFTIQRYSPWDRRPLASELANNFACGTISGAGSVF
jgi:hypothetical protein